MYTSTTMEIVPLGHSAFKLRGKSASVVCDPYDPTMVGLTFPKHTSADIITVSHSHKDHSFTKIVDKEPEGQQIIVHGPGEYEIRGVSIIGIQTDHDGEGGKARGKNTVYRLEIDTIVLAHLGDLGHTLSEAQVELLDGVDVLFVPVGGVYSLDAKTAVKVVSDVEPKIVIPMHYKRPELKTDDFGTLAPVADFLKEIGKEGVVAQPKLKVTKDTLNDEMQVVILE